MDSFGKKITALRKEKKISQGELAKLINTSTSVIGRYERDEMTPSIEAARKRAKILGTTVGYLLDETEQENLFKDPDMLKGSMKLRRWIKRIKTTSFTPLTDLSKV